MTTTTHRPASTTVAQPRGGDRFVGTALLVLAVILAVYQGIAGAIIPPLAAFTVLFAAVGALVWRVRSRWPLIASALLALAYVAGGLRFFAANLAHPESPVSFLAEAFLLVGLLTVLAGAAAGLRGAGPGDRRRIALGATALGAIAVAVSVIAALAVTSAARQPDDAVIEVVRSRFPAAVEVPAAAQALWVDNQDAFHHTIVIDDSRIRAVLPASTAVRVPMDLAPGTYRYWCDVPGHESMEGELHVR